MFLTAQEARTLSENYGLDQIFYEIHRAAIDGNFSIEMWFELNRSDVETLASLGYNVEVGNKETKIDWLPRFSFLNIEEEE